MAMTTSGSTNSGDAARVSPPGVTRAERLANVSQQAADADSGAASYGDAFIDGDTAAFNQATRLKPPLEQGITDGGYHGAPSAPSLSGDGTGFPGIGDGDYYPDSGGDTAAARGPANVVRKSVSVKGGQAGTQPAPSNSPGFPGLP